MRLSRRVLAHFQESFAHGLKFLFENILFFCETFMKPLFARDLISVLKILLAHRNY